MQSGLLVIRSVLARLVLGSVVGVLGLSSCTNQKQKTESDKALKVLGGEQESTQLYATRPTNRTHFLAIVKLKNPPLLNSIVVDAAGVRSIDPDAVTALESEQADALASLKALSEDIRVIYTYKKILNGFNIVAPIELQDKIKALVHVSGIESVTEFKRPSPFQVRTTAFGVPDFSRNSAKFIGADSVHTLNKDSQSITGVGMSVGVIDTGIDYTHSMFLGAGTVEAFKAVDPKVLPEASVYPNSRVIGGIDLVGTEYNAASPIFTNRVPTPDLNPIDEGGHGTHVAGTIAGRGDNVETYSGVAPDAALYSLKVFGADGSTSDGVVIAALEYAADPNKDNNLSDQLSVVNMSLGSSWGSPQILYNEAINNLSRGGTVVVASAGNSGHENYIVGAPSVSDEAISVAASVDDSFHNWQFGAVEFQTQGAGVLISETVEAAIGKKISEAGTVKGKLVFIGLADADLTEAEALALKGNVALIKRGKVTFAEKLIRAEKFGAIAAVVVNNQPGAPFVMGGDGRVEIPGIMISQALGAQLLEQMNLADVVADFNSLQKITKPELIDTLTDFSSKGPRGMDALLKPEISAPGAAVISADMGMGNKGIKLSGTSMAGPHVAGVMALLKQGLPTLTSAELKSVLMGRALSINDAKKQNYPLSQQGAGRVQAFESITSQVVASAVSVSLGELNLEKKKTFLRAITIKNISGANQDYTVELKADSALTMASQKLSLLAGESKEVVVRLTVNAAETKDAVSEVNGLILLTQAGVEQFRIPVLAIVKKVSQISASDLVVNASSAQDSVGSAVDLQLKNQSMHEGQVLLFNLLGVDGRKQNPTQDASMTRDCDLQAVGYRLVDKVIDGKTEQMLQVSVKLYEAVTTWNSCEVNVQIDTNGDGTAEQELAGLPLGNVPGASSPVNEDDFFSVLLDAGIARASRLSFEQSVLTKPDLKEDYSSAVVDLSPMNVLNNSTVMVLETKVSSLAKDGTGLLRIKASTTHAESSALEFDDFLDLGDRWLTLSTQASDQAFMGIPESIKLSGLSTQSVSLEKGLGSNSLMVLMPSNRAVRSTLLVDEQMTVLESKYSN